MTLQDLTPEKKAYIEKHYTGNDDVLVSLTSTETEAFKLCREKLTELQNGNGWKVGDIVNGKEVEFVSFRVDHQDDHFNRSIEGQRADESYVDYIKRISIYFFYTAAICRRFKNPLNGVYTYDDEINGATPVKLH